MVFHFLMSLLNLVPNFTSFFAFTLLSASWFLPIYSRLLSMRPGSLAVGGSSDCGINIFTTVKVQLPLLNSFLSKFMSALQSALTSSIRQFRHTLLQKDIYVVY